MMQKRWRQQHTVFTASYASPSPVSGITTMPPRSVSLLFPANLSLAPQCWEAKCQKPSRVSRNLYTSRWTWSPQEYRWAQTQRMVHCCSIRGLQLISDPRCLWKQVIHWTAWLYSPTLGHTFPWEWAEGRAQQREGHLTCSCPALL